MKRGERNVRAGKRRGGGFTLVEILFAMGLGGLTLGVVMAVFLWSARESAMCSRMGWSQDRAIRTGYHLTTLIRNAKSIEAIDEVEGEWVTLRMPDERVVTLRYLNAIENIRDGRMVLEMTNATDTLIERGLTEMMGTSGFTLPMFTRVNAKTLGIGFRVTDPSDSGIRDVNDAAYAASLRFSVGLRNAGE